MILTDRFVYIHLPKTGGTFVTSVLERLLKPPAPRTVVGRIVRRVRGRPYRDTNKHGTCSQIPPSHRGLPVVSCVRNPYDRWASGFDFGWWKDRPPAWVDMEAVRRRFPSFPDLTFEEYLDAVGTEWQKLRGSPMPAGDRLGFLSETFVRFFFRDPEAAWRRLDDAYIARRGWEEDLHPVRFLRMENLNRDLHGFLVETGFDPAEVAFVLEEGKILPAGAKRPRSRPWQEYFTPESRARVRRSERLLFAMFPEYDAAPAAAAGTRE